MDTTKTTEKIKPTTAHVDKLISMLQERASELAVIKDDMVDKHLEELDISNWTMCVRGLAQISSTIVQMRREIDRIGDSALLGVAATPKQKKPPRNADMDLHTIIKHVPKGQKPEPHPSSRATKKAKGKEAGE